MMQLDKSEEREMEMLLNEIPHVTSPQNHHQDHQHLSLQSPLSFHDMHGHGHAHVNKLIDHLQSSYIDKESINPFLLEKNLNVGLAPRIPINDLLCENLNVGFSHSPISDPFCDPYWDSNALNLSTIRSPSRSLSPVESFHSVEDFGFSLRKRRGVVNGSLYGSVYNNLMGSVGSIYVLAKDQHGCRFLQGKFDEGKNQVDLIFDGVIGHISELMIDPFGNYLLQKLFDVCSEEQRMAVLLVLTEDPATMFRISMDSHGYCA